MNRFRSKGSSQPKKSVKRLWLSGASDWITRQLGLDRRLTSQTLAKIIWIATLAVLYVYFQHNFDRLIRKTEKAGKETEEQRAVYIYEKSAYLFAGKQSEIEKKVSQRGFTDKKPIIKISIDGHE